jgi:negative regulator of sigma-B (phosphoserine phosphatase)
MSEAARKASGRSPFLAWAATSRPMRGEQVSGDRVSVQLDGSRAVLAVVDGLGHGPEAAAAARLATDVVEHNPAEPIDVLLLLVHRQLANSRGAAATVAILDADSGRLHWLGVGNVEGVVVRADELARPRTIGAFLVGGVLGYQMNQLHAPTQVDLADGDVIVIATDGVRAELSSIVRSDQPVERMADRILAKYGRPDDDALVLVARYATLGSGVPSP